MIRYVYYHNGSQYVDKITEENERRSFEGFVRDTSTNSFLYIVDGNDAFLVKRAYSKEAFIDAYKCVISDIPSKPSDYIDALAQDRNRFVDDSATLDTSVALPSIQMNPFEHSQFRDVNSEVVAKIIDAIINGNGKQIIILASQEVSKVYLKALSSCMPASFIKRVSFAIGADNLYQQGVSIYDAKIYDNKSLNIQLVFTDNNKYAYEELKYNYYVFDLNKNINNYDQALCPLCSKIKELELANKQEVNSFVSRLERHFSADGKFDNNAISQELVYDAYANDRENPDQALLFIESFGMDDELSYDAIKTLLKNDSLTDQVKELLYAKCREDGYIDRIRDELFEYLKNKRLENNQFSSAEEDLLISVLCACINEESFKEIIDEVLSANFANNLYEKRIEDIPFVDKLSKKLLELQNHRYEYLVPLITVLVDNYDLNSFSSLINKSDETVNGEKLFDAIKKIEDNDFLCAILLVSAYKKEAIPTNTTIRENGFYKKIVRNNASIKTREDAIKYLIKIRFLIEDICKGAEIALNENFSFLASAKTMGGTDYIKDCVKDLSFDKMIDFCNEIKERENLFTNLYDELLDRLLDEKLVKNNVKAGASEKYRAFYNSLAPAKKKEVIDSYLHELQVRYKTSEELVNFRKDFSIELFNTLSETDKRKVLGKVNKEFNKEQAITDPSYVSGDKPLTCFSEELIATFGGVDHVEKKGHSNNYILFIWVLLFVAISFFLLTIPSLVINVALGKLTLDNYINRAKDYIKWYYFAYVGIALVVCIVYFYIDNKKKLKNAIRNMFFYVLLPLLVLIGAYLAMYFIQM